jgi:hypothetical protein
MRVLIGDNYYSHPATIKKGAALAERHLTINAPAAGMASSVRAHT